jgi:type III restriction enzyme
VTSWPVLNAIGGRLSLREPQKQALRILAEIDDLIAPGKDVDLVAALARVREAYPSVEEFERDFPNLCFTLATGVGKTRLMGAFVAYLALTGRSRNFFALAPSTTIYDKLVADFSHPRSPKYVFKGIPEFAQNAPTIVTGETWSGSTAFVEAAERNGGIVVNIFNVDKINKDKGRVKRLSEYLGESYFDYLAGRPDLVLLMDEAHRYRNDAAMRSIAALKPILGIEVTATPKVSRTGATFKNVIYSYGLPEAMRDGFIKEPAVGTRANWSPAGVPAEDLQRIMLEDGVHYHEHVRVALETYALQHGVKRVHPFILVVAQDIAHAKEIKEFVESDAFFGGRYRGRVIDIHSGNERVETEANSRRLLELEDNAATDIVIHVNQLKEGWDVTNLYTIVPLRAANADVLKEQTLGRGLRLPFGKRTGVDILDTLTVIKHDGFEDLINQAKAEDSILRKTVTIGDGGDVPATRSRVITARPIVEEAFAEPAPVPPTGVAERDSPAFRYESDDERRLADIAYRQIVPTFERKVRHLGELRSGPVRRQVMNDAIAAMRASDGLFPAEISDDRVEAVVNQLLDKVVEQIIEIPKLTIVPRDEVSFQFRDFDLVGLDRIYYQPRDAELIIQQLRTDRKLTLSQFEEGVVEARPENYLVRRLVDFDEIDYGANARLLYKLCEQLLARLRSYLPDEEAVRQVLIAYAGDLAKFIYLQMQEHMDRTASQYDVRVTAGFTRLHAQHFEVGADQPVQDFRVPPRELRDMRRTVFGGFRKAAYREQKFDTDGERRFAVILEDDPSVLKWMKPGPDQFVIEDRDGERYRPDFVVETETEKLIVEPKSRADMTDEGVRRKSEAAVLWCHIATEHHAKAYGGKPWRYVLVPDDRISGNATLRGLVSEFTVPVDLELLDRFDLARAAG